MEGDKGGKGNVTRFVCSVYKGLQKAYGDLLLCCILRMA